MARKKSTSRKRGGRKKKATSDGRLRQIRWWIEDRVDLATARRVAVAAAWVALIGAGSYAWMVGVPAMESRVAAASITPTTQTQPPAVVFRHQPEWMSDQLHAMLVRTAQQHLSRDPLADSELQAARRALLETRCFADVSQVTRRGSEQVLVDATFLVPFAIVRHRGSDLLIDSQGRLLPSTYRPGEQAQFITIDRVRFNPPVQAGHRWDGEDIVAAIQLIQAIEKRPWRDQVARIVMDGVVDGDPIVMVTDRGCRIVWRSQPGSERPGEVPATEKLRRLDWMYTQWGHIDGGYSGELEITQPHPAVVHRQR